MVCALTGGVSSCRQPLNRSASAKRTPPVSQSATSPVSPKATLRPNQKPTSPAATPQPSPTARSRGEQAHSPPVLITLTGGKVPRGLEQEWCEIGAADAAPLSRGERLAQGALGIRGGERACRRRYRQE